MGNVQSLSPSYQRVAGDGPGSVGHDTAVQNSRNAKGKNLKHCSIINMKRKKGSKKVQPNGNNENNVTHLNNKNLDKSQSCTNLSTLTQDQSTPDLTKSSKNVLANSNVAPDMPKRVMVQASTGELLHCLGEYLCRHCYRLQNLSPNDPGLWLQSVDRFLLNHGWGNQSILTPANVVFVYMLCRKVVSSEAATEHQLQAVVITSLYLTCSYMGNVVITSLYLTCSYMGNVVITSLYLTCSYMGNVVITSLYLTCSYMGNVVITSLYLTCSYMGNVVITSLYLTCSYMGNVVITSLYLTCSYMGNVVITSLYLTCSYMGNVVITSLYLTCSYMGNVVITSLYLTCSYMGNVVITSLYLTCSYMGNKTSPLRPFLVESSRDIFWESCLSIINLMSGNMPQMSTDQHYFFQLFANQKNESQEERSRLLIGLDQ
ncbi:cyclin-dependent kinase 5 activator 1-like [Salmo salar]|uniref:Cyclin-dependent kinase 5 activator 1 n=1 Tax=Salmo salar TaxID=8030 RepID=A0ABM3DGJ0_SALSA|nr:cyclin-dependent kinase 5 activator 1-like [Salmo salar]